MTAPARQRDVVAAAVESLHPEHRQVLVEAYFRGRSVSEASRTLGLPVRVVKLRVYEALRQLREVLATDGQEAPAATVRDYRAA